MFAVFRQNPAASGGFSSFHQWQPAAPQKSAARQAHGFRLLPDFGLIGNTPPTHRFQAHGADSDKNYAIGTLLFQNRIFLPNPIGNDTHWLFG